MLKFIFPSYILYEKRFVLYLLRNFHHHIFSFDTTQHGIVIP